MEWTDEFPPADNAGNPYRASLPIHLSGRLQQKRLLVKLGEHEVWVREKSFEIMLRLAVAAHTTELGWALALQFGNGDSYYQHMYRLKQDLGQAKGVKPDDVIENSGQKHYRFSIPPKLITLDRESILRSFPEAVAILRPLPPNKCNVVRA